MIRFYMVYNCIHLYWHSFYDVCGVESVTQIVVRPVFHYHPVYVPICAYVISSAHIGAHTGWECKTDMPTICVTFDMPHKSYEE